MPFQLNGASEAKVGTQKRGSDLAFEAYGRGRLFHPFRERLIYATIP